MLSLIICSRRSSIDKTLVYNIDKTIGVNYEIITIDNSDNTKTIFQAYNEGVSKSNGDILCFMHEDIEFLSECWGGAVVNHFITNSSLGVLGVIGGHCLPACPCSWWSAGINSGRIWQGDKLEEYIAYKKDKESSVQVAAVDGLWLCIPRRLFDAVRFDEEHFNGFHSYDTDICLQVTSKGFEIHVAFDIDIRHKSGGSINQQYFNARNALFQKWKQDLPLLRGIELRPNEMEERQKLVKLYVEAEEACYRWSNIYNSIYNSKAYRLGKAILSPIKWIRKIALKCQY